MTVDMGEIVLKNKMKLWKKILLVIGIILMILALIGMYFLYGPDKEFRNLFVTSCMGTMTMTWLPGVFYSAQTIDEIMLNNRIIETGATTNTEEVQIGSTDKVIYTSEEEKTLLTRENEDDKYNKVEFKLKDGNRAWIIAVFDPADVSVGLSSKLGKSRATTLDIVKENNALVGINAGGFEDDGWGDGTSPQGTIIKDGKIVYQGPNGTGNSISLTYDNKLFLSTAEAKDLIEKHNVRDSVEFGPFLIVNGTPTQIIGDGGWGRAPRCIIAQRKDGVILFLVTEGRRYGFFDGANMNEIISILTKYGAYNAANLDGGASTTLIENNKMLNKHYTAIVGSGGRGVSNAFIVK